jgi:hypothetical protein
VVGSTVCAIACMPWWTAGNFVEAVLSIEAGNEQCARAPGPRIAKLELGIWTVVMATEFRA